MVQSDLAESKRRILESLQDLGLNIQTAHPSTALFLHWNVQPNLDPQLLADILNLRVNLGDLGLIPLQLSHEGCEVVARNEGALGLKVALLVFDDLVDVAHGKVVDVSKAGYQA
jgi:hypothetical protein